MANKMMKTLTIGENTYEIVDEQARNGLLEKSDSDHIHTAEDVGADASGSAASALTDAKLYTDTSIANLINGAPTTLDTLKEIADAMGANADVVEALESAIGNKADIEHTHNPEDIGIDTVIATDENADGNIVLTNYAYDTYGEHIEDKSNPHNVTIEQIGAAPVSHMTDKSNPHNVTIEQIGAAPSGYGLGLTGSHLTALTDANEAQRNGWYLINKDTANGVGANAIMRVESEAWAHCVQTAYGASHSSSRPLIRQRVKCNGTWSGWVDCDPAAFAPSGYGLGAFSTDSASLSDANTAIKSGWYRLSSSTANGIGSNCVIRVDSYGSNYCTQTAYLLSLQHNTFIQRQCVNGTWTEWAWVNPPMQLGVEYLTTEMYEGKPVYTKLVDLGESANLKVVYVLEGNARIIRHEAMYGGTTSLPFINDTLDNGYSIWTLVDKGGVAIKMCCGTYRIGGAMTAQIWYTKD